jgi:heme O synthase-like polyprenyltransferase
MTSTFIVILAFIGIGVIGFGLGYLIRRRDVGSKAAARDARRGIALALAATAVGFILLRLAGEDISRTVLVRFLVIGLIWVFLAWSMWRRGQAGRVLVDLGRSDTHKMFLVGGCVLAGLGVLLLVGGHDPVS